MRAKRSIRGVEGPPYAQLNSPRQGILPVLTASKEFQAASKALPTTTGVLRFAQNDKEFEVTTTVQSLRPEARRPTPDA